MREMRVAAAGVVLALMIWAGSSVHSPAFAQKNGGAGPAPKILLTATLDLRQPPFTGAVERIQADGQLRIGPFKGKPGAEIPPNGPVAEGLYLGVVRGTWKDLRDARLVRVDVTEVMADGVVVARVGLGLDQKIPVGKLIFLVRPPHTTSAQMQALPDLVTLEDGPLPMAVQVAPAAGAKTAVTVTSGADTPERNLAAIAKALHRYNETNGCFPPAALIGPDGKAWHSWRVLILPYFDDRSLRAIYDRYAFDEPWDGPHNKQLLAPMPLVYTDQTEGNLHDAFTRYAAVTGPGTMFSAEGNPFDPVLKPRRIGHGTRDSDLRDSAASTLSIGTLGNDAKIPWIKPEDVVVGEKPLPIGANGNFGAHYKSEKGRYALFARVDGGLAGVYDTIDPHAFHTLLTIAGKEGANLAKMPDAFLVPMPVPANTAATHPSAKAAPGQLMTIAIFEDDGGAKARFTK